jgi:signal transduction histidine kinase
VTERGHELSETEASDAARRLEAARREAISWVLSGLMHESRNALQQIGSCAEMLAIELADRPQVLDLVQGVEEAQSLLVQMLDDLRTYSAPLVPSYRRIDLAPMWRHVWQELTRDQRWSQATLHDQAVSTNTHCQADPALITYVLIILLGHALSAAGSSPQIEIACHELSSGDQSSVAMSIICPSRQLTPDEQRQLFDPFFCRPAGGSGLRLAIARRFVELHGGSLEAKNASSGGTELVLTLPRRPPKKT